MAECLRKWFRCGRSAGARAAGTTRSIADLNPVPFSAKDDVDQMGVLTPWFIKTSLLTDITDDDVVRAVAVLDGSREVRRGKTVR